MLMAYEVTKDLPLESVDIETPLEKTSGSQVAGKKLTLWTTTSRFLLVRRTARSSCSAWEMPATANSPRYPRCHERRGPN